LGSLRGRVALVDEVFGQRIGVLGIARLGGGDGDLVLAGRRPRLAAGGEDVFAVLVHLAARQDREGLRVAALPVGVVRHLAFLQVLLADRDGPLDGDEFLAATGGEDDRSEQGAEEPETKRPHEESPAKVIVGGWKKGGRVPRSGVFPSSNEARTQ